MKKLFAGLVIAIGLLSTARAANLIDLTPGGFNASNGLPPAFFQVINSSIRFLDEARPYPYTVYYFEPIHPPGWVSRFGVLNHGVYFDTNAIASPGTTAQVSWNFTGSNFRLTHLFLAGGTTTSVEHIYGVSSGDQFQGSATVTLDGVTNIISVAFYGQ
jgi:opacity protein-like surface antigen